MRAVQKGHGPDESCRVVDYCVDNAWHWETGISPLGIDT